MRTRKSPGRFCRQRIGLGFRKSPRFLTPIRLAMYNMTRLSLKHFIGHSSFAGGAVDCSSYVPVRFHRKSTTFRIDFLKFLITRTSFSDTLQTTTPLVNKLILTWLTDAYVYHRLTNEQKATGIIKQPRGVGYGIGLAFALFVMQGLSLLYTASILCEILTVGG